MKTAKLFLAPLRRAKSRRDGTLLTVCDSLRTFSLRTFSLRAILLPVLAFFFCAGLCAQVTIGGLTEPVKGAILDLNSSVKGGLLLSNVAISDRGLIPSGTNLFPNIVAGSNDDTNLGFTGAVVYNTGTASVAAGVYVWDGYDWVAAGEQPPGITKVSPAFTLTGNATDITVTGTHLNTAYLVFIDLNGNSSPDAGEECTALSIVSDTQITCRTPAIGIEGSYNAVVKTPGGTATLSKGFEYLAFQSPDSYTASRQWVKAADTNADAIASITGTNGGSFTGDAPNYTVDIDDNMIPVVNKDAEGNYPYSWGNYDEKQWCNAVTVKAGKLAEYKAASIGTPIEEDDILGYWVYVPRYAYQVMRYNPLNQFVAVTPFTVRLQKSADTKYTPAAYTGTGDYRTAVAAENRWATHPAFTFDGRELNGIWVGKFETGTDYYCANTNPTAPVSCGANVAPSSIFVKPGYAPMINKEIGAAFRIANNMGVSQTTGGNTVTNNTATNTMNLNSYNSRLQKNDEWGAVVYLSKSAYGTGNDKIYNNGFYNAAVGNNTAHTTPYNTATSGYMTGCGPINSQSDGHSAICHSYEEENSTGNQASTTGNIYGIYDMAGGTWEIVMGNLNSVNESMTVMPPASYYNMYPASGSGGETGSGVFSNVDASNAHWGNYNRCNWATCGGHALYEVTAVQSVSNNQHCWDADASVFAVHTRRWFRRSSTDGSGAGLYASFYHNGVPDVKTSFRVVLSVY
jgi:hypothetical protein